MSDDIQNDSAPAETSTSADVSESTDRFKSAAAEVMGSESANETSTPVESSPESQLTPGFGAEADAVAPPLPTSFREQLIAQGLNVPASMQEADIARQLAESYRQAQQIPELQRMAQYGYQVQPYYDQFQQWRQTQGQQGQPQQAPPQQVAPQPPVNAWNAPEYDPEWESLCARDPETQELVTKKPYYDQTIPQKLAKAYEHQRKTLTDFARDPSGFLQSSGVQEQLITQARQIAQQEIQQAVAIQRQQSYINETVQANQDWIYAKDQNGQVVRGQNGSPMLTDQGMNYAKAISLVQNGNPSDPAHQDLVATLIVQGLEAMRGGQRQQQAAPQAPQLPVDPRQQYRQRVRGGAGSAPNRTGTVAAAAQRTPTPQNSQLSYKDMLKAGMAEAGLI